MKMMMSFLEDRNNDVDVEWMVGWQTIKLDSVDKDER